MTMLDEIDVARLLADAHRTGRRIAPLPQEVRPKNEADAWKIQDRVATLLGVGHAGWKVSLSAGGDVIAAPILAPLLLCSPARLSPAAVPLLGIEAEIAFHIGRPLVPAESNSYSLAEIESVVDGACAAIEVLDSRYKAGLNSPKLDLLADHLCNGALIVGALTNTWKDLDLATLAVRLEVNGKTIVESVGGNSAGNPLRVAAALANHLPRRGLTLKPGDIITTGTCTGLIFAKPGDLVRVSFLGLKKVELRVTADPSARLAST